jgi:cathepsin B
MKAVLLLALVAVAAAAPLNTRPAISEDMVSEINSIKGNTWTAGMNSRFEGMSVDEVRTWLGALSGGELLPAREEFANADIPDSFDSRDNWKDCADIIGHIRDQSECGSCWAFGGAEAMSDRHCIASKAAIKVQLSTEDLVSCCGSCGMGCNGGFPQSAWQYGVNPGLVSETDYPYFDTPCEHHTNGTKYRKCGASKPTPSCDQSKTTGKKYTMKNAYSVGGVFGAAKKIQQEIMENGPVEGAFSVYEDFLTYKSGVYTHKSGQMLGGHAIKILGWGVENGVDYWLVANSWNEDWGDQGYFKILRGKNECGIEGGVVAGLANV